MADTGGDYFHEIEDFDISQIIRIQAAVRGTLVRKWMKEVKQAFEETFIELEKNTAVEVDWDSKILSKPKVVRTGKRKILTHAQNEKNAEFKSKNSSKCWQQKGKYDKTVANQTDFVSEKDAETIAMVTTEEEFKSETVSEISEPTKDSPRFNSVEIQTSFVDVNFQNVPNNIKHDIDRKDDLGNNILEDLDTSWKDRVEPFIRNNFGGTENTGRLEKETAVAEELHLHLETDAESVQSQRSSTGRNTGRNKELTKPEQDVRNTETSNDDRCSKFEVNERNSGRSQSFSRRRHDQRGELSDRDQRSSRSEDRRRRSPEYSEKSDLSCRRSVQSDKRSERDLLSSRSHRSDENGQNLYETERFSPRGQRSNTSQNSDSRSQKSPRSEGHLSQRSARSEGRRQNSHRSEKGSEGQLSHRSDKSEGKRQSEGSVSHRSDKSEDRKSQMSQKSRQSEGQRSGRKFSEENMHPQQSRASPVAFQSPGRDGLNDDNSRQGRPPLQDSTSLTNVTSVWDSFNSVRESHDVEVPKPLPHDATQLKELRKNIAMELLWVQQAIDSRKNYLKLKGKM